MPSVDSQARHFLKGVMSKIKIIFSVGMVFETETEKRGLLRKLLSLSQTEYEIVFPDSLQRKAK